MNRLKLLSATFWIASATSGCQPEVLIAQSDTETSGTGGQGLGGGGSGGATAGSHAAGGPSEPPVGGEGGSAPSAEPARILADSVADFSLTQGERGWSYGYDTGTLDTFALMTGKSVITNYVPASNDAWDCWNNNKLWTQIFRLGAHPNGVDTSEPSTKVFQRAVRRWTSTFAGSVTISGEIAKIDIVGSNGVDAFVFVDGKRVYDTFIAGDDGGGRAYQAVAVLNVGSTVDFVLDPHASADQHDLSRFTGIIVRLDSGPAQ